MKTAAYMIIKDEVSNLDAWMHYAQQFDYRVVLDTGSTDGTWEKLQSFSDTGLIIEQKEFAPFRFDSARNYNLSMVPEDVDFVFAPDSDEWYQLGTRDKVVHLLNQDRSITCIGCTRLDIRSYHVWNGPPHHDPHFKIHTRHGYYWNHPVYESVDPVGHSGKQVYCADFFLIHKQDQDKDRVSLYVPIMEAQYEADPTDTWNMWFLLHYYYNSKQFDKYVKCADNFLKHSIPGHKYNTVTMNLKAITS